MTDRDAAPLARPGGFSKWFGRLVAVVLILAAAAIAFAYLTQDASAPASRAPAGANPGIRLN